MPPVIVAIAVPSIPPQQVASVVNIVTLIESGAITGIFNIAGHPAASTTTKSQTPEGNCIGVFGEVNRAPFTLGIVVPFEFVNVFVYGGNPPLLSQSKTPI